MVLALVLASCGGNNSSDARSPGSSAGGTETTVPASAEGSVPYALLDAPGWTLQEAVNTPVEHILSDIEPVPSDWYAEYSQLEPVPDGIYEQSVTLTGLEAGLDAYRTAMEPLGLLFETVETSAGSGLTGTTSEQGARPVVVAVPIGTGTLQLLSYELSSEKLLALIEDVTTVDEADWRAAGGQIS